MPTGGQSVSAETLEEVVERLVALASPIKIILFGSNARGEAQLDSSCCKT
jgi:predicted nucleotidyltransferase